jgi:hypothetical protein
MNSNYLVTKILSPLTQAIFPRGRAVRQKQFMVHVENCSIHTSRASTSWLEEYSMPCMPHPLYWSNLPSSDFYLFPTVKEKLERIQVRQEDQSFECLQEIVRDINHDELNGVFRAWMQLIQEISQSIGDYLR